MIWGFSDVSLSFKTNYFYLWRHQDTSNNPRRNPKHSWEIVFYESQHFAKSKTLEILEKARTEHHEDPPNDFENLEYGINTFLENMKWKFGNMGSSEQRLNDFVTLKL